MGELILARIAAGETVKAITADPPMPCYATVYRWTHMVPEFGAAWRELRTSMAADAVWIDRERARARAWMRARARRLAGKPPRDWTSGRRSTYTPERGEAVCDAVLTGASLSEVAARPDMPSLKAIYRWLRTYPAFRADYARCCELRGDMLAEEAPEACRGGTMREARRLVGRIGRTAPRKYRAE